jgi:hypothetical protein
MRVVVLVWLLPAVAWGAPGSYTFGGFSPGEREYWKRGAPDLLCTPPAICQPVDRKDVKGFSKPARSRRYAVEIVDDARIRLVDGERELGSFAPGGRVTSVNANLFVAPGAEHVAVEYEVVDKGQRRGDVLVFALAETAAPTPAPGPAPAPAPSGASGAANAYERAMGKGGVWEQRQVPCEDAGVTLNLKKTKKFAIRIATKCQGQKDVTQLDGTWSTEGNDTLVLSFEAEEGATESMICRFAACPEDPEDCLTCAQDDVSFTMRVVRR